MKKNLRHFGLIALTLAVLGQLAFAAASKAYTTPRYENRLFATTGVRYNDRADLHALTDAAHYFGQTMIGWLKFPNFLAALEKAVPLPEGSRVDAHIQERQNIIFTVYTDSEITQETLRAVKDFIQGRINEYNKATNTQFVLTNVDYEQAMIQKTYAFGAAVTLLVTLILATAGWFLWRELKD